MINFEVVARTVLDGSEVVAGRRWFCWQHPEFWLFDRLWVGLERCLPELWKWFVGRQDARASVHFNRLPLHGLSESDFLADKVR